MATQHDFEFQLGRNRALKGRGWRGLVALGLLLLTTCVTIIFGSPAVLSPIRSFMTHLIDGN